MKFLIFLTLRGLVQARIIQSDLKILKLFLQQSYLCVRIVHHAPRCELLFQMIVLPLNVNRHVSVTFHLFQSLAVLF